ncbi:MAG: excisionase family DNA-binding protein [Candidatus Omnitrophica bacterium]|nr:excisionase family DNA-binding protein [Candidatus Omnitrophota bacterium]
MKKSEYISISEAAKLLGISRIAVYKKVKKGQIKAIRIGRSFAIPTKHITDILGRDLTEDDKKKIDTAVKKTIRDYGEVLKLLGRD